MKKSLLITILFTLITFYHYNAVSQNGARWVRKVPGNGLGNPFAYNPLNDNIIYCSPGSPTIWISRDRGNTWSQFSTLNGGNQITSIIVNPRDTNHILVGQQGGTSDFVKKSTDGGLTWTIVGNFQFSYFGVPLEWVPEFPDLVYAMNGTSFVRSVDFGSTWETRSNTTGLFNEQCDMVIRPDNPDILYLGDNGYGIWKSTNAGATWAQKYNATAGEVPMMAIDHNNPMIGYGTKFSGTRGMVKTTDGGETWALIPNTPFQNTNTWGVVTSLTHTNYVYMGTYGGSTEIAGVWFSRNEGATWERFSNDSLGSKSNYGMLVLDTLSVFVLQGDGIYKYRFNTQSSRNVKVKFSVNADHSLDFHNDAPLVNPTSVYVKGELPVLGSNGGNWTFADTSSTSLTRLYDDGTHGDITPNDKIWSRDIIFPVGTPKGQFKYKYGAAYNGVDTVNNGIQYLNNEAEGSFFHSKTFDDVDTVLVFATDVWRTRGISQSMTVQFSVDVSGGVDVHNFRTISDATSLWLKGDILPLGKMRGNWTFSDTTNNLLTRLYNDGTHNDSVANDKIWTTSLVFPEYTRIGMFSYRYGASYSGVDSANGGVQYLNNEMLSNENGHIAMMEDGISSIIFPRDKWRSVHSGILAVSDDSLSVNVPRNQTVEEDITLLNVGEVGGSNLHFYLSVEDADYDTALLFGAYSTTGNTGREKGNIYYVTASTILKEISLYGNVGNSAQMYFFVYEGNTRTSVYKKVFAKSVTIPAGEGWKNASDIRVNLKAGKFYYIGSSWQNITSFTWGRNSSTDSVFVPFGFTLQGQGGNNVASYPPVDSVFGSSFTNPNGYYYQQLKTNTTPYIALAQVEGSIAPQQSLDISFTVNGTMLEEGSHSAVFTIESSDRNNSSKSIPLHIFVLPPVSVNENENKPLQFALNQNYPNPFNPTTQLSFVLPASGGQVGHTSLVVLKIYDVQGKEVTTLVNENLEAGKHSIMFNASTLPSGIYFAKLSSGKFSETRKLLLMK